MNCKKLWFAALCAAGLVVSIQAADVSFTGGAGDRDLSKPANWGGALPSDSDVGVVNTSTFGASYTVGSDATISGLKFEKGTAALTLAGPATLTLGAGGLVVANAPKVTLSGPLATSVAQTWDFGGADLETSATFSGDAALTVSGVKTFKHDPLPGYSGAISYIITANCAQTVTDTAWADTVTVRGNTKYSLEAPATGVAFSTLFPGGFFCPSWTVLGLLGTTAAPGLYTMTDGDVLNTSGSNFAEIIGCRLQMDGGTITVGNHLTLGEGASQHDSRPFANELYQNGGTVTANMLQLSTGSRSPCNSRTSSRYRQNGGTVTTLQLSVGGGTIHAEGAGIAEYVVGGPDAVLDASAKNTSYDYGITLSAMIRGDVNNQNTAPAALVVKDGTVKASRIEFGANWQEWPNWGHTAVGPHGYGFGFLGLYGGSLELGAAGLTLGSSWNAGSVTGSVYRIDFAGGTLKPAKDTELKLAFNVPTNATPFTWQTAGGADVISAPVTGEGTLRKTGEGRLSIMDATGFKGKVDVTAGTLALQGGAPVDEPPANCLVYSADELAKTIEEGGSVSSWPSLAGTTAWSVPSSFTAPTLLASSTNFNGHASVKFTGDNSTWASGLYVPNASNPLTGCTNATVIIVLSAAANGLSRYNDNPSIWNYNRVVFGNPRSLDSNYSEMTLTQMNDSRYVLGCDYGTAEGGGGALKTASSEQTLHRPHVIVMTVRDRQTTLDVDGGATMTNSTKATRPYPRYDRANGAAHIYLGASTIDSGHAYDRCFRGEIAEVRIYPHVALGDKERRGVMAALLAKYGAPGMADTAKATVTKLGYNGVLVAPVTPAPVAEITSAWSWNAATLTNDLADGASVATWKSDDGKKQVTCPTSSGAGFPTFVRSAMNGHPAVRFDAARETCLSMGWSQLPYAQPTGDNKGTYSGGDYYKTMSLAIVFQSSVEGYGQNACDNNNPFQTNCVGLVSSVQPANWAQYWALSWDEGGAVGSCFSTGAGAHYNSGHRPAKLADGKPHVAIMTYNVDTGDYQLMVDGVYRKRTLGSAGNGRGTHWNATYFGALNFKNSSTKAGFFTGDLAEVKFFDRELSKADLEQLTEYWTQKYDVRRPVMQAFGRDALTAFGLSATNVNVAAGATFEAPVSKTTPLTLGAGQTLTGAGTFAGSYRFGEGAVIDTAAFPADVEDVQIAGGATIIFKPSSTPFACPGLSSVTGTVTLDVSALDTSAVSRIQLLTAPQSVLAGATFELVGAKKGATVVYNVKKGCLELKLLRGLMLIVR